MKSIFLKLLTVIGIAFAGVLAPKIASAGNVDLAGSAWVFAGTKDKRSIQFDGQTRVIGFVGCNRFFGKYKRSANKLKIGPIGSTKMACMGNATQLELEFFAILGQTRSYQVDGKYLVLRDSKGGKIAKLQRQN